MVLGLLLSGAGKAEGAGEDAEATAALARRTEFVVAGAAALPDWEGADGLRPVPLVVSRFRALGLGIEVEGLEARFDFVPPTGLRAGPAISLALPRNSAFVDDASVEALPSIGLAVEVGGFVGFDLPVPALREGRLRGHVSARHDTTGNHGGLDVTADAEVFFALHRVFRMGVGVNASFATDDYMETYFAVTPQDALASGLPAHRVDGGLKDVGGEVYTILSFHPHYALFTRVAYNRLLNDAAASPIVRRAGSPDQVFVGAGIFWLFR
ncbi:MAG: MipA/OmpV family protein [Myxococcota bacterium]